jgi:hypothetical protein
VRLGVAPHLDELHEVGLARLKVWFRQATARYPILDFPVSPMAVLSIDLAHINYVDVGVAILEESAGEKKCDLFDIAMAGRPSAEDLAGYLNKLCLKKAIKVILLDGPQGWMSTQSDLNDKRHCEKQLNTPRTSVCREAAPLYRLRAIFDRNT